MQAKRVEADSEAYVVRVLDKGQLRGGAEHWVGGVGCDGHEKFLTLHLYKCATVLGCIYFNTTYRVWPVWSQSIHHTQGTCSVIHP